MHRERQDSAPPHTSGVTVVLHAYAKYHREMEISKDSFLSPRESQSREENSD